MSASVCPSKVYDYKHKHKHKSADILSVLHQLNSFHHFTWFFFRWNHIKLRDSLNISKWKKVFYIIFHGNTFWNTGVARENGCCFSWLHSRKTANFRNHFFTFEWIRNNLRLFNFGVLNRANCVKLFNFKI